MIFTNLFREIIMINVIRFLEGELEFFWQSIVLLLDYVYVSVAPPWSCELIRLNRITSQNNSAPGDEIHGHKPDRDRSCRWQPRVCRQELVCLPNGAKLLHKVLRRWCYRIRRRARFFLLIIHDAPGNSSRQDKKKTR